MDPLHLHKKQRNIQDAILWILFITSILFLSSPNLFGQCSCSNELVPTVSTNSSDGFETYAANQPIPLNGNWSLYPASQNYNPIPATVVSNPTYCGSRSLRFQNTGFPVDMSYAIDEKRTTFFMYVTSGKSAKFALLTDDAETAIFNLFFGTDGSGEFDNGGTFFYPQNQWFRVSVLKTGSTFRIFINYDHVGNYESNSFAGYANFYGNSSNDQFYIDRLCNYYDNGNNVNCTQELNPQCAYLSNEEIGTNPCYTQASGFISEEFFDCDNSGNSPCDFAMDIDCGETVFGSTINENYKFYRPDYTTCLGLSSVNDYLAPDKVYSFFHAGGDVQINLWSTTQNVDLDIFLLDECGSGWSGNPQIVILNVPPGATNPHINCIGRGISSIDPSGFDSDYIYIENLPSGTYYIVVDGQHWNTPGQINDVGDFVLSLHCHDLDCTDAIPMVCGQKLVNQSNNSGKNDRSIYCSPAPNPAGDPNFLPPGTGCTGREKIYSYTANVNGDIEVHVTGIDNNEDFEVFIFSECDPTFCIASGTRSYGEDEIITFDGFQGITYIIVVDGYFGTSGNFDIEIKCEKRRFCDVCMQCFKYKPKLNVVNTFEFSSGWCDEAVFRAEGYTNIWSVENTNVSYADNTTNVSLDPVIIFPGTGKYRVCQKIYSGSTLLYECCQFVDVKPCSGEPKAFFTATYNNSTGSFSLNGTGSQNIDNIIWQFSDPDVSFVSGNSTSLQSTINIPNGRCVHVCFNVYNGCGMSTYCIKLCKNNPNCSGTTPPVLFSSLPQPVFDGRKITYSAPLITNATYLWDMGDGSDFLTTRNISYTYPKDGNHVVCLRVTVGCFTYCYCWCVRPRLCPPVFDPPSGMISHRFSGSTANTLYTVTTSNFTVANEDWLVDGSILSNSKGNSSMIISLPQDRDYIICIPYLKPNGCIAYKCITIRGGNPFNCTAINWRYIPNQGYQFELPSGFSEISWIVDETSQFLGSSAVSNILPPLNNCEYRTVSVRFFDGQRYIICCLRIYVCFPVNCRGNILYQNQNTSASFALLEAGATNISWYFDDAPNAVLGTSSNLILPYPTNCLARTISVRYKDVNGNWKICCIVIYWCSPLLCESNITISPNGNNVTLITQNQFQEIEWFVDNTLVGSGNSLIINLPPGGQNIYVKYRDPATGCIYICCKKIGTNPNAIMLELAKNICGPQNSEVLVPITVKNYKKVVGLQFRLSVSPTSIAEFVGVTNIQPMSGLKASDFTVSPGQIIFFTDSDLIERTLADGTKLCDIRIRLKGQNGASADVLFTGDIKAINIDGADLPVSVINGTVCVQTSLTISGKVSNALNKPLGTDCGITLEPLGSKYLVSNGMYLFDNGISAGSNYNLYPIYDSPLTNGIDVSDLLALRKHMQGLTLLESPYKHYAADMDDDAKIDVADLLTLRKIMQGLTTTLPNERKAWKFIPKSYNFPNLTNPLTTNIPTSIQYTPLTQSQINQDFIGVKRGDLNHSVIPFDDDADIASRSQTVSMSVQNVQGVKGQEITVDLTANNFKNVLVMEFSLSWPQDKLELVSVPSGADIKILGTTLFNETLLNQGKIGAFWEAPDLVNGLTLVDGSTLYRFTFRIKGETGEQIVIQSSEQPRPVKLIDKDGEVPLVINQGIVTIGTSFVSDNITNNIVLYPNPTTGMIRFEHGYSPVQSLEIRDMLGRLIYEKKDVFTNDFDVSFLVSGTYQITGTIGQKSFIKKLVVIR